MTESSGHFAAFSFVDRITDFVPGKGARGVFHVPAAVAAFPACLVAEAVGQLAAWVSMEHIDYRGRPVAALAGETRFLRDVAPGDVIQLFVSIDDVDDDAVSYRGWADVDGARVLELNDCLGPMLPTTDFDAPDALRERFALLRGAGAPPDRFHGVVDPVVEIVEHDPAKSIRAMLKIPAAAPFFADHFPRRPVFPATLLLNSQIGCASQLVREANPGAGGSALVATRMTHVKMRAFIVPGQQLDSRAELAGAQDTETQDRVTRVALSARDADGKIIATARVEFTGEGAMTARRRVAITGLGLVTPVGNDVDTTWDAVLHGKSGGASITLFDASGFPVHIAAEVKNFDDSQLAGDRKLLKFANRSHRFALAAAEQALRDAGIRPTDGDATRWGCAVGAGMMGVDFDDLVATHRHVAADGELHAELLLTDGPANDPLAFCRSNCAAGLSLLTRRHGILGYATSVHTACASGGQALGTAMKLIRRGAVDSVLAGGFDSMISPVGIAGFCLLSALSPDNDTPQRASRPFDASRNGFLLGEGAGFLVLEEWEAARRRGARIYAELAGDGNSLSSYRITDSPPDGDGPIQAMQQALASAGAAPDDIDYLNAHGTSTGMNDRSESAAVKAVFGAGAGNLSVSSTKSTMGHLIAAAGAVEVAICALSIRDGLMPINANLVDVDPDCDLNLIRDVPRRQRVRMTMSNSFGFGGSNSCIVLRSPEDVDGAPGGRGETRSAV